ALPTRETEDQLGLNPRQRSDIQRRLSALGYFEGKPDGNFNDNTRRAIERWQTARRYPRSGYFNKLQHDALLDERLPAIRSVERPAPVKRTGGASGPARPGAAAAASHSARAGGSGRAPASRKSGRCRVYGWNDRRRDRQRYSDTLSSPFTCRPDFGQRPAVHG